VELQQLQQELQAACPTLKASVFVRDLAVTHNIEQLKAELDAQQISIDILVNNERGNLTTRMTDRQATGASDV